MAVDVSGIAYMMVRKNINDVLQIMNDRDEIKNRIRPIVKKVSTITTSLLKVCSRVILVFDGNHPMCPCKAITSISREIRQRNSLAEGRAKYYLNPDTPSRECYEPIRNGLHISTKLMEQVIDKLIKKFGEDENGEINDKFCALMAPGEADQQLAYLYYHGWVDAVISGDSDMIVYNVPLFCPEREQRNDSDLEGRFYEPGTFCRLA